MTRRLSDPAEAGPSKRSRVDSSSRDLRLPDDNQVEEEHQKYLNSTPYKHAVTYGLISDELLESVVEESRTYGNRGEEGSLPGWGWEQKETDIYKIQQTPDLSSLDPEHLPEETLAGLPQLTKLKDALYSPEFRSFVRRVTGCGPLSGKKTDGSVGLYTKGSHLLLHDDSISTRLVSYILYLPNSPTSAPSSDYCKPSASGSFQKGWDPTWGGSLELYPVEDDMEVGPPAVKRSHKIDVTWGQIVFFEVQPGRSYHAVEEVIVGDDRQRLGISGWFHRPIEGEEGYEPTDNNKVQKDLSSLAQITAAPAIPFRPYKEDPPLGLKPSHLSFLSEYLSASYLTPATLEKLSGQFVEASEISLHNFLNSEIAESLKKETQGVDTKDYISGSSLNAQDLGESEEWTLRGPSSKHRYLALTKSANSTTPILARLLHELLPSEAFRAWLSVVSSLASTAYRIDARRFRKGLDYTLANGEPAGGDVKLDVCLGATWWADVSVGSDEEDKLADEGGWDCYLASPDEDEDPAVYQSKHAKRPEQNGEPVPQASGSSAKPDNAVNGEGENDHNNNGASGAESNAVELEIDPDQLSEGDFDSDSEDEADPDEPLLIQPVSFNKLLIVLRDPAVMKFVKYLGAGAPGSRWDIVGEWEVGAMEEDAEADEQAGEV